MNISNISGGVYPIYNFLAPNEYLEENLCKDLNDIERKNMLVYYFSYLYPMTPTNKWTDMSVTQLQDYYNNLDFWYVFNSSWGVSPYPVTLGNVVDKWSKNTFYQAGTIIQTSITSFGWDLDNNNNKFYLSSRLNNAPQTDPNFAYTFKGKSISIKSVARDKNYWETVYNKKIEITSWGWNPYPFGIYLQGPFKGSGNFVQLPSKNRLMVGTCHWNIIWQSKADNITNEKIWSEIMNHELSRMNKGFIYINESINCTPYILKKKIDGSIVWEFLTTEGGHFPLLTSYYCFIIGGFGGIGNLWKGNNGDFFNSWSKGFGEWNAGFTYVPIFYEVMDKSGKINLIFPEDQSLPILESIGFPNGRNNSIFWKAFGHMFLDYINQWDINWVKEMWRYPIFYMNNTGPVCNNPSDDFMQAMITGNFKVCENRDPSLSKYSNDPVEWSHVQLKDGSIVKNDGQSGIPVGHIKKYGSAKIFVIRTQMPNVNGDINTEFADFRAITPGNLADGSGDQEMWKTFFKKYCAENMYTVDPFDEENYHNFSGDFEPIFPDTTLNDMSKNWSPQENSCINKTFFDFDPISGKWVSDLAFTGKDKDNKEIAFNQYPGKIEKGTIKLDQPNKNCDINTNYLKPGNMSFTISFKDQKYYSSPTDSFRTGNIGFGGMPGACQTRWCISSKGIAWKFNAPLANRLMLKNGIRLLSDFPIKSYEKPSTSTFKFINMFILISLLMCLVLLSQSNYKLCLLIMTLSIVTVCIYYIYMNMEKKMDKEIEKKRLFVYLSLVYPMIPIKRLKNMTLKTLRKFFCALHLWFKGDNMPSPVDYLGSDLWNEMPPFDLKSSWKNFTTRKMCVVGTPQSINDTDGKIYIGYDKYVNTTKTETSSGILYRGRQLLPKYNGTQQTTFFEPSFNYWIDTYNGHASVNDTNLDAWKNVKYVEVSSQWGPFPDGAYFDWAQGSGVWLKFSKPIVGYSGLDVIRKVGEELYNKLDQKEIFNGIKNIYIQEWQRTGIDNMKVDSNGNFYGFDTGGVYGLYGSIILTKKQKEQLSKIPHQGFWVNNDFYADDTFFSVIDNYSPISYYDSILNKWTDVMPLNQGHVLNYPFPLPFGSEEFIGDSNGNPIINEYALKMPWKYQLFNIAFMVRSFCTDALFLNENALPFDTWNEYVDLIMANVNKPLTKIRSWKDSIDVILTLIQKPIAHPFFSKYNRTLKPTNESFTTDGPIAILTNNDEWSSKKWGEGVGPSIVRIQTGCLDKKMYLQDTIQSGGTKFVETENLPQLFAADLEIDHWMSELSKLAGYDTCARIQHWCGNKSLCYDIEIIAFRIPVPGNLITNKLSSNIYEVWKDAFKSGWLSIRDPFHPGNQVYSDVYKTIYNEETTDKSVLATWNKPAWIGYDPSNSLYGWPCESLDTFFVTQRLSYPPITAEEIGFSNAFPEYNSYIYEHFLKKM